MSTFEQRRIDADAICPPSVAIMQSASVAVTVK